MFVTLDVFMRLNNCVSSIIHWFKKEHQVSIDNLVCESLLDEFSQQEITRSLHWLTEQKLICCPDATEEPFVILFDEVAYSEKNWTLTELAEVLSLDFENYLIEV
jgi:hypothetical protein